MASPEKNEEATHEAWTAIRLTSKVRQDPSILDNRELWDIQGMLATIVDRGMKRKLLRKQARENLELLISNPHWLEVALADPELIAQMRGLLEVETSAAALLCLLVLEPVAEEEPEAER